MGRISRLNNIDKKPFQPKFTLGSGIYTLTAQFESGNVSKRVYIK